MQSMIRRKYNLTYAKLSAIGFFAIIFIGAVLLSLPISSKSGEVTPFINALFTATSATGVTGLVVYDTYSYFSVFGQSVILVLIKIGGLGFMIIATMFLLILKKKIGIRERNFLKESVNTIHIGGVVRLAKHILVGTLLLEGIGAIILAIKFSSEMGVKEGIFNGIFHSVSAFNNAGFDLMGRYEEYSSLIRYSDDALVNITIMTLIVIGGIGFLVWEDIYKNKAKFKKYHLHSKIVLLATMVLIFSAAIGFYVLERNNLFADMGIKETILASLFQAITPRTAGFNTIDTAELSEGSKLLTMILMFIGGSSGSTAGGIKTTTFIITILSVVSLVRHSNDLNIFGRRLEDSILKRAYSIITIYITSAFIGMLFISFIQPELALSNTAFEVLSAMGTVGLSTGITRQLNALSRLMVIILMFCGRLGSLAVLMAVAESKNNISTKKPLEKIVIG
ncbi:trk system potassium uptake protein TrkH [Natronincola peptidivorans]|uniref:Trk system potassium uptake protein TrkH n=1 Tax=Natronincola peptidivorans TaxID=426128 RepID=A0A1H9Y4M3_9FIRM|nr:TrkH family potassium uptake protein [Natronincola peptidivorans]SES63710.1 trk system potassium uptake protein TrkH [Natronincola peptidivorans]